VSTDALTNLDWIDAAQHLKAGTCKAYGDAAKGFIVVPLSG